MYFNVSSVNSKENYFFLEIPRILYLCCVWDCRAIELSDYRAVGLSSCPTRYQIPLPGMIKENEVYNNNDHEGPTKIVNFTTPPSLGGGWWVVGILLLGCGHISHIVKIIYSALFLLKSSSLLSGTDQINWWYSNDDLGRVCQNCKFFDPRACGSYVRTRSFKSLWWICIRSYFIILHDIDCYCING